MKVLPIKLPDELYLDLKHLAKQEKTTVSNLARIAFRALIKKEDKKQLMLRQSTTPAPRTASEDLRRFIYRGPGYNLDKTDDELLYGGKLGDY